MKRVLAISPRFPPTNAADHQRLRMALPHFEEFGWKVTVLAVESCYVEASEDPLLLQTLPDNVDVVRVPAISVRWTRRIGFGGLGYRSWFAVKRAGDRLLHDGNYDLIFFTTTEFLLMAFGPIWQRCFQVPYIIDLQDPWVTEHYDKNPDQRRPGGFLKHGIAQRLARHLEPKVVRQAGKIICVSPGYPEMLRNRYPDFDLKEDRFAVIPFCAAETDLEIARSSKVSQSVFDSEDGKKHWVYTGRAGPDMVRSLTILFTALRLGFDRGDIDPDQHEFHFVGTDYAVGRMAQKWVVPVAKECGVEELVEELPERLPYFSALRCLCDADVLIVPGSNDPNYTASKLYPYILAKRPLLAIFHERSSVVDILRATKAGEVVTFGDEDGDEDSIQEVQAKLGLISDPKTDWDAFSPYMARAMTQRIVSEVEGTAQT